VKIELEMECAVWSVPTRHYIWKRE